MTRRLAGLWLFVLAGVAIGDGSTQKNTARLALGTLAGAERARIATQGGGLITASASRCRPC